MVKPRRRKLGRLGDNLNNESTPEPTQELEREVVTQETSIAVPVDVAEERSTANLKDDGVRARRRRLGLE